jgi:DNA-binding response OmpR family regulator
MIRVIYLMNDPPPDTAIIKGLRAARCEVIETYTITETLAQIKAADGAHSPIALICELDAGAIPLLVMLHDGKDASVAHVLLARTPVSYLPILTMVYDRQGRDAGSVIRAFQLGVCDYVLATAPAADRELAARLLVERCQAFMQPVNSAGDESANPSAFGDGSTLYGSAPVGLANSAASPYPADARPTSSIPNPQTRVATSDLPFNWDAPRNVIHCGDTTITLSPTEGRIFDLLMRCRGITVSAEDIIRHALQDPGPSADASVERIRSHVMKLRRKLDANSCMANRIINVRGTGYIFM